EAPKIPEKAVEQAPDKPMALTPPPPPPAMDKPPVASAPVPPPPPASTAAPETATDKPAETQTASLPPASAAAPGIALQVLFTDTASKLPGDREAELKKLAADIKEDTNIRVQLLAYAGGESLSSSKARRLSLSRALSVRAFLINEGIRSTRIDVRALGDKVPDGDPNRVDVSILER
ncbi:MAG: OmpA family protein, partial [Rhodospirillales bacterium]|nr:OmpA family protein [Rhodospirillales bacterium]